MENLTLSEEQKKIQDQFQNRELPPADFAESSKNLQEPIDKEEVKLSFDFSAYNGHKSTFNLIQILTSD